MTEVKGASRPGRASEDEYAHLLPLFEELTEADEQDERRAELRERLVTEHRAVAEHIAMKFRRRGESQEDLTQVAMVGLINAVDRFDPTRGTDFLAFAIPTIMGEVRRYFRDAGWAVRVPRRLQELHLRLSSAASEFSQRHGRAPNPRELAAHLDISLEDVVDGLQAGNAYRASSLEDAGTDDEGPMAVPRERLGADDDELEGVEDRLVLGPLLTELPPRERRILILRFYGNLTQTEIAERIGISQMHVSRLLANTLQTLREQIAGKS